MSVRITLALLAYNQEPYIEDAVGSALSQECEPIQILISDDCSTDRTYDLIKKSVARYEGPHEVVVRRTAANLGIGAHFNALMTAAKGRLVVMMAGDDISRRDRVAATAAAWDDSGEDLDLIAAHLVDMDEHGHTFGIIRVDALQEWRSVSDWARRRPYSYGAAHAVSRRLFDRFGPLNANASQEDQVNMLRAVLAGRAYTIDDALVMYRRGGISTGVHSAATYRSWEARRTSIHLAVFEQWVRDAGVAGHEAAVRQAIERDVQGEQFLNRLVTTSSFWNQVQVVRSHTHLNWKWRWKRLLQLRAYRAFYAGKRLRRRLSNSEAAGHG
jgi:glycosyltransferase involved in cell wall biosynthesis